jgi:acetylornithine deacetylase/succinyl-diaminopimelate desuccinylase-like protein
MLEQALDYARGHQAENLERLLDWLRIPSVSTLPEYAFDVMRAARWAGEFLSQLGMPHVSGRDSRSPIVYAEWLRAQRQLVYGTSTCSQ